MLAGEPRGRRGAGERKLTEHVGQVDPRVGVLNGRVGAGLPEEAAVLLEEAGEGAAARSAVEPDGDFVAGTVSLVFWWSGGHSGYLHRLANGGLEDEEEGA